MAQKLKITEMNRLTPEEFKLTKKLPLVVVLDNVRSLHNVGSVFRTGDAFLIEAVYLCGITCTPPHAEIHKTALGAENTVDWEYFNETLDAVNKLKTEGYTVFSIEQAKGSILLPDIELDKTQKYAVVLGNEVKGVQQMVVDAATTVFKKKGIKEAQQIAYYQLPTMQAVQILHIGPFATEHDSLIILNNYMQQNNLLKDGLHHEIYLSDFRKTAPEKLKTILREPAKKG